MFYSKSTGGFYTGEVHGDRHMVVVDPAWVRPLDAAGQPDTEAVADTLELANPDCKIPPDAIEITAEAHAALLQGQSAGKLIGTDAQGRPVLKDPPAVPFAALKAQELATFRADRGKMLDCLSGMAGRFARAGDPASALACDVLAQGLLDLPAHPTVAAALDAATLRTAMKTRYNTLLAAVPAPVMAAYRGVLA